MTIAMEIFCCENPDIIQELESKMADLFHVPLFCHQM